MVAVVIVGRRIASHAHYAVKIGKSVFSFACGHPNGTAAVAAAATGKEKERIAMKELLSLFITCSNEAATPWMKTNKTVHIQMIEI